MAKEPVGPYLVHVRDVHELAMLLEGVNVSRAKTKPRWEPPPRTRPTTI